MSETNMAYIYGALILRSVDKKIDEVSLSAVLEAGGMTVDTNQVRVLVETLNNVSIEDFMKAPVLPVAEVPAVAETRKEEKREVSEKPAEDPAKGLDFLFQQ